MAMKTREDLDALAAFLRYQPVDPESVRIALLKFEATGRHLRKKARKWQRRYGSIGKRIDLAIAGLRASAPSAGEEKL